MKKYKLSIIIPSYKDSLLNKTIESILYNSKIPKEELEIIVVLDGYIPNFKIINDSRIKLLYLGKNRGMRGAINIGISVAKGEYLMRTDEHCCFGKGFDRIILQDIKDNEIVVPRRFFLDTEKWEVMNKIPIDNERLGIDTTHNKFSSFKQIEKDIKNKDILIEEKSAFQGSVWFMKRSWWDEVIGELQTEGYNSHYQDSVEMSFKTWQKDGRIMVNKNTWYAHKDRSFDRTHNYPKLLADESFAYSLKIWKPYYEEVIKPRFNL